jgi:penicillin-binding protein 1A
MLSMMKDTMRVGTAARAARLGRSDLAGKTGTTNEFVDAWFAGYQPNLVAISWVGFDQPKTLGKNMTGSVVALPIWIGYMEKVLKDFPEVSRTMPEGVVSVPMAVLSPNSDTQPPTAEPKIVPEFFYQESVPPPEVLRPPEMSPIFSPPPPNPAPPTTQPLPPGQPPA